MALQDFTFHAYLLSENGEQTFATFSAFLAQHGLLLADHHLYLPDGGLSCAIQCYPVRNHSEFSIIRLDCDGSYFDACLPAERESEAILMMPFLQAWQTYIQWCTYLCDHVAPLFGVGFGLLEDRSGDIENICVDALHEERMPTLDDTVLTIPPFAQYVDERFVEDHMLQKWYKVGYIVRQLPSQGAFGVSSQRQSTQLDRDGQLHLLRYARQLAATYLATHNPDTLAEIECILQNIPTIGLINGDESIDAIRDLIS